MSIRRGAVTISVLFTLVSFAAALGASTHGSASAVAGATECATTKDSLAYVSATACGPDDTVRHATPASNHSNSDRGYPKYCCTSVGRLGPYDNDSVPEGGACYGTKNGRRYEGTACYGNDDKESKKKSKKKKHDDEYPQYCCTDVGRLGPYKNDSVPEGGSCYGTKNGRRYEGTACYGDRDDSDDDNDGDGNV